VSVAEHNHAPRVAEPEPEDPPAAGAPAWTATFSNLMLLLLCFFVLQLSFATIEAKRAKGDGLPLGDRALIDLSDGVPHELPEGETALPEVGPTPEEEMMEVVDRVIRERGLTDNVEAAIGLSGVTVRVDGPLMFQSDSDALKPEAAGVFEEIAELAVLFPYDIAVEGHSGDVPQPGGRFATDWELSTAQAVAAVRYLIEVGRIAPERMHVAGFAHTRPLAENGNEVDQARNHRLEFVFHRPEPGRSAPPATTRTPHAEPHGAEPH
jgi:chemotaxis protein MotB